MHYLNASVYEKICSATTSIPCVVLGYNVLRLYCLELKERFSQLCTGVKWCGVKTASWRRCGSSDGTSQRLLCRASAAPERRRGAPAALSVLARPGSCRATRPSGSTAWRNCKGVLQQCTCSSSVAVWTASQRRTHLSGEGQA